MNPKPVKVGMILIWRGNDSDVCRVVAITENNIEVKKITSMGWRKAGYIPREELIGYHAYEPVQGGVQ